jgi:hypothetical protein
MASTDMEQCPKCRVHFETRPAILDLGQSRGLLNLPSIPPRVVCPTCRHEFHAQGMRYFGFINPHQLRAGMVIYTFVLAAAALLLLFW